MEHEKNLDLNDPKDLIDEYLIELKKKQNSSDDSNYSYAGETGTTSQYCICVSYVL